MVQAHVVDIWSESANVPTINRPAWQARGNCHGMTEVFFYAPRGRTAVKQLSEAEQYAKNLCAGCPVRDECLSYALENDEQYGIWGGLTPSQRDRIRL